MIQIIFEFETQYGLFRHGLYLPDDHGLTDAQIEEIKQDRLNGWIENLKLQESVNGQ